MRVARAILTTAVLYAGAAQAQPKSGDVIDGAADLHYKFQNQGGLNQVIEGIAVCYSTLKDKGYPLNTSIMCAALDVGAAKFDVGFMALAGRDPTLSISQAEERARASLIRAGVPPENVANVVSLISEKVTRAINERYTRDARRKSERRSTPK